MKTSTRLFALLLFFSTISYSQSLKLITDYLPGSNSSMNEFNSTGLRIGNKLYFAAATADNGEELCYLENNEIKLLKDIWPGKEGSGIKKLTALNGKLYFLAKDQPDFDFSLWESDGTTDGTKRIIKTGRNIFNLLENDGTLFFGDNSGIYYLKDQKKELIYLDESLSETKSCKYNGGIAFSFISEENDSLKIISYGDGVVRKLGAIRLNDFSKISNMAQVDGGVVLSIENSSNSSLQGTYFFSESTKKIEKINSSYILSIAYNDKNNKHVFVLEGVEYYTFNNGKLNLIDDGNANELVYQSIDGNILYYSGSIGFDSKFVLSDGEKIIKEFKLESNYVSNIVVHNQSFFVATGISNGFKSKIYQISNSNLSLKKIFDSTIGSSSISSVLLTGFLDNNLIVSSFLDKTVGRELYSLAIDLTNNNEEEFRVLNIIESSNQFKIESPNSERVEIKILDVSGKMIKKYESNSNEWLPKYNSSFPMIYSIKGSNKIISRIMFNQQ